MAKRLPSIPKRQKAPNAKPRGDRTLRQEAKQGQPVDLSYIAESIRPLAVPVVELEFDPANARKHGDENLQSIRASLRVHGQVKPIVANSRMKPPVVVCGNGTLQAALALGWSHIAVVQKDMDPTTAASLAIADNRTAELAEWDDAALDKLLRSVQTDDQELAAMFDALAKQEGIVPGEEGGGSQATATAKWEVIVQCTGEEQQKQLFERLQQEGYECRLLTL